MGMLFRSLALAAVALVAGCSVNPVTGEKELSLMSPAQEIAIGSKQYSPSQQSQGGRYSVDPDLTAYVNQVGQRLAVVSDRTQLPYEFVVLNSDIPNAWALPGGKIAINRGLLIELEDEAQLAAVLGHEIVHAAARHSAQQMTQSTLLGVAAQVATVAGQKTEYGELIGMGSQLGANLYQAHYGRDQELEADYYGMTYMARAGYDPSAAIELQQTFVRLSEGQQSNWLNGLFSSHPPSQQRVDANRQQAANLGVNGKRNKAEFDRAMRQLRKDLPAYELHQEAIKAANKDDNDKALSLVNRAIQAQPNEASFYITQGQLLLQSDKEHEALTSFKRAHNLYPEYYLPLLGMGVTQKALKAVSSASTNLSKSYDILPTQIAAFHLGEIRLAQGDKQQAVGYFQQAYQGGGALGEKAQAYLQELSTTSSP